MKKPIKTEIPAVNEKAMILKLSPSLHNWVRKIADASDMTQPNVVKMVLEDAVQNPADSYINRVNAVKKEQRLKELLVQQQQMEAEIKKLQAAHS